MKKINVIRIANILIISIIILFATISFSATNLYAELITDNNFNIWTDEVHTTYSNNGYTTVLKVGSTEYESIHGTVTGDSVTCTTELSFVSEGRYVKITYHVKNNSAQAKTIGVATHADVQIGEADDAPITNLEGRRGFNMTDGTNLFTFLGRNTYGVTDVDTYWFGHYNSREENMWNDSSDDSGITGVDSGIAFSWKNRAIQPNQTLTFSALIGMGELNSAPTITANATIKSKYKPGESINISGVVNDADVNDIVSVKYSIDGGNESVVLSNCKPNGRNVSYTANVQLPDNITKGEHYVEIWAVDDKGNFSQAKRFDFTVVTDETPPTATHTLSTNGWTNGNVTIQIQATDDKSGVKRIVKPDGSEATTASTNYTVSENGTYKFVLEDNDGNSGEYNVTINNIDKKKPVVGADPEQSDWVTTKTVRLSFTDEGGSGFRGYKYAITTSSSEPSSWSSEIKKANDSIVIDTEGKQYLHVIAYDNANNVSDDRVLGVYNIDRSGPTIQVTGDFNTITTQEIVCNIRAIDLLSGLKTVSVNGETLTDLGSSAIQIHKNGTYVVRAEDNIGNVSTKELVVTNIYQECTAGLEHPIYSSDYEKCPICSVMEGLEVTKDREIYDAREKGVTYYKPEGATIVEYYNESEQKPIQVGTYHYDLKVVYNGKEYNTGVEGIFEITKKTVTIEKIVGQSRQYDGTNKIALSEGNLVGIEENDKVGFTLPLMGIIPNKDIGEYHVTIPEIVLTGEKAQNYNLIQPSEDMLTVTVSPRELTITELQTVARPYNKKTEIEIVGGKLNNLVEGNADNIGFNLNGGIARSELAGEQIVDINTIELTNNEIGNYVLIPPEVMTVWIEKKEITIENIKATNRQYDGTDKIALSEGNLVGIEENDQVGFTLLLMGSIPSKNIGEYRVSIPEIVLTGEKAQNYSLIQPSEDMLTVTVSPRELTITELETVARPYNKKAEIEIAGGKLNNLVEGNADNIDFVLNGGIARSELAGEQIVDINTIELTNNEIGNYVLIPPEVMTVWIEKKEITIENIKATNRQYDGTAKIALSEGNLVGIEENDEVGFTLPLMGSIPSKNIGEYHVSIPEIVLTGEKAQNYSLIQPSEDMLTVTVSPRELTITELETVARPYNKKAEIEIVGGKLNNLVEGNADNIGFVLNGGIARSELVGEQIVDINTIALSNNEIGNYVLIPPESMTVWIEKKEITIENMKAANRQYDGTNRVALSEGNLIGIEENDQVGFTLPLMGSIPSKNIGEYHVTIPKIVLTGEKAQNYNLIQPSEDMLTVTISPRELTITELQTVARPYNKKAEIEIVGGKLNHLIKGNADNIGFVLNGGIARSELAGEQIVDINTIELTNNEIGNYVLIPPESMTVWIEKKEVTIENIEATNRQYDRTNEIVLTGGDLIGIEEGDDVQGTLPEIGTVSSKDIGDYNVMIPEIVLTGEKAPSYEMIQPAEDAVKVTITPRELTIDQLKIKNRKYDKTNVVEIEGGELKNVVGEDDVKAIIPKTGVISNADIGTHMVEIEPIKIEGKDSYNYVLIQPKSEEMLVEISKPSKPNLQMETFISHRNGNELQDVEPKVMIIGVDEKEVEVGTGTKTAEISASEKKQEEIRFADRITITMRIYNMGEGNGYAQKITDVIPEGMKFVAEDSINQENEWKQIDDKTVVTEKLNFASGEENEIEKWSEEEIHYKDIELVLEVTEKEALEKAVENSATIEQVDIRNEKIDYEEENEVILPITVSHTDFVVEKTIQDMIEIGPAGQINHTVMPQNNQFSKIEIHRKNINETQLKIVYHIKITNIGNTKGNVDAVIDYLPKGLQCSLADNAGWTVGMDNHLICQSIGELEPGETKTKELVVTGKASQIIGNNENQVVVLSNQDIDQRMVQQENKTEVTIFNVDKELFKTNNYSKADLIISIATGAEANYLIGLGILTCLIVGAGILIYFKGKR